MTRKEFIEASLLMGIGLPLFSHTVLAAQGKSSSHPRPFSGRVVIIGAGAAGLTAGYLLKRHGVDFQIIEAAPVYGGRLKKVDDFADFPIDLGAEWIHTHPKILGGIIGNEEAAARVETIVYNPKSISSWKNDKLIAHNYLSMFYSEWKFKRSTWFDFFETFVLPEISDHLLLNTPITKINYDADRVVLSSVDGRIFEANKALVTVPVSILKSGLLDFQPPLPAHRQAAIDSIAMGDGIKIFVKFKERFYPHMLAFGNIFNALKAEDKFMYDAALGKPSNHHILGLFAINDKAAAYTQLPTEEAIMDKWLSELDQMFDDQASKHYERHVLQNWSKEPFIQGAYSHAFDGHQKKIVSTITEPLRDKIYFAGEAFSIKDQSMVHGACGSAAATVAKILEGQVNERG